MQRIVIYGNSGSGKSTLAKQVSGQSDMALLDLDTITWQPGRPGERRALSDSLADLQTFIGWQDNWVIEGCYGDLIEAAAVHSTQLIFLNPGVARCVENNKKRPWEPHKYVSKSEQDARLEFLLDWVREYETRKDEFSLGRHRQIFDNFNASKRELQDIAQWSS